MEGAAGCERESDGPFEPAGGVGLEDEGRFTRAGVGDAVQMAPRDRGGQLNPMWPHDRAVDALMVITGLEAFETLTDHGTLTIDEAADLLAQMTDVLLRDQ